MSNFAWWYYSFSFTYPFHFKWPLLYFKVKTLSYSFNVKFHVPIRWSWHFLGLLMLARSWICHHFLLARKKKVSLHNNHCYTGMLSDLVFQKIVFFADTTNMINVTFCMKELPIELYPSIILSVTLSIFISKPHQCQTV